jgi:PAS domain S-box-containing protein
MAELPDTLGLPRNATSEPKASILLVDDNPANLLSLRALLDGLGQNLVEARSGEEALQRIQTGEFAVVLLDVLMPGMGGFEAARALRDHERSRHTPIIFLTASDIDSPQMEEGYALGAVDFLVKPVLPVALQAKVRGFVQLFQDKQRTRREAEQLRLLVHGATDYAIFLLDPQGYVASWNAGAERIKQYKADEIIGQHFSRFYPKEAIDRGWPAHELEVAKAEGRFEDEGWRVRRDGTQFWANVIITALHDEAGHFVGYSKITRDLTERKKSEENARRLVEETTARRVAEENARLIQEQRERLHVTLASIGDAVISTDAEGRVEFLNSVAQELVGWKQEEAIGRPLVDVFHIVNEDTRQPVENPALRALKEGVIVGLANHTVLISKDGHERPIDDSAAPIRDATGRAFGSVLVFRDISERKQNEERLREQQEWLRVTLASIGDAVIATDTPGRVTFLNDVAEELTGWNEADAKGQPLEAVFAILNERTREPVENPVEKVLRDGAIVGLGNHTVLVAKDGTERPVDDAAAPIRDGKGKLIGVVLTFRDVTDQRRTEREVRQSEARKSAILESALDCVITMNHEGSVVEFNPAAEKTFGYRREQVVGQQLADLIIPLSLRERHHKGMAHYLTTGEGPVLGKRLVLPALRADGTEFPVELTIIRISTDGPPLFTAYLRDITEQKRVEQHRNVRLAVTPSLNEASSVNDGASGVLKAVCENLGWDVGFFWTLNEEQVALVCQRSWHRPDVPVEEFETVSCGFTFEKGRGLPGRVWASGKPEWIFEIVQDANFPRLEAAVNNGLHSAFACPINVGHRTLGVIEFFTKRIREADADLLEMMGTVAGGVGQFIERKAAEDELRRSEQRFRQLADAMPQIVWTARPDGNIDYLNRRWIEFTGLPETLGNDGWGQILHPDEAEAARERWAASVQTGAPFEMEMRLLDRHQKTYRWHLIRTIAVHDEAGRVARWFGTSTDIHEQKRAEESSRYLAEASAALATVVDYESTLQKVANLAVPYFADWSAVDVAENGNLRRLAVAHQDASKVGLAHELMRQYPPDPQAPNGVFAVFRTGKPEIIGEITDDLLVKGAKDDLIRSLGLKSYICVPLIVAGETLGVLTFATAESGRRYTEADLALATDLAQRAAVAVENTRLYQALRETDRRKDEFLATLAHELRNPLAPIRNALQILNMPRVDAETVQRSREMMDRQVHHLVRLVDDLLDVSRVMRGKIELRKERVELASVVARAVETVQPLVDAQGHQLSVRISPESLLLDGDPVRLAQVIGNLLTNAAKYTESNGRIWLTADRDGDMAVLRVRDSGIGIAPNMLPRIFELFVQVDHASTKAQGGLGIGLTLVKNLVEMHNGTVVARSEGLGKGSEFIVRLPISVGVLDQDHGEEVGKQVHQRPTPSGYRLLVVDDNQDAANSLAMLLKLQGHEVRVAFSGVAALEMTKTYSPDVVFMDIGMPGMDGYEAARRIREQPGLGKVVLAALTGWGQDQGQRAF